MLSIRIDGQNLKMELDTSAPYGIISKQMLLVIKSHYKLLKTDDVTWAIGSTALNAFRWKYQWMQLLGSITCISSMEILILFLTESESQFAHELFEASNIHAITSTIPSLYKEQKNRLNGFLTNYESVFSNTSGKLLGSSISVHSKSSVSPVCRAREVSLALRDAYAKKIDAKIASEFYEKVDHSKWGVDHAHSDEKKMENYRSRATINIKSAHHER